MLLNTYLYIADITSRAWTVLGAWIFKGNVIFDGIVRFHEPFYLEDNNTKITRDASLNMSFTDAVTGTKTLAELASGGGGGDYNIDCGAPDSVFTPDLEIDCGSP